MLPKRSDDHWGQAHQRADRRGIVPLSTSTTLWRNALRIVGKECTVIRLGVGIVVTVRGRHKCNVLVKKRLGVVATERIHGAQQHARTLQVQCVVPSLQAAVIVLIRLAPKLLLPFENHVPNHLTLLSTTPGLSRAGERHDRIGVNLLRGLVVSQRAEIALQSSHVVVPMNWHGQRITDKHPPQGTSNLLTIAECLHLFHLQISVAFPPRNKGLLVRCILTSAGSLATF